MKENNPLISVIVPVYNVENYLSDCIESILNQSLENFELILVNDGSTDSSGYICDEYARKDNRINAFHKSNGGVTSARSYGVKMAIGEYINFVDSDDTIPENSLMELLSVAESDNLDIVSANYVKIINSIKNKNIATNDDLILLEQYDYIEGLVRTKIPNGPWAKLFKRELFDEFTFELEKDIVAFEDLIMNIRLALKCRRFGIINKVVYYYHLRDNSVSQVNKIGLDYYKKITPLIVESFQYYKLESCQPNILSYLHLTQIKFLILDNVSFNYRDKWLQNNITEIRRLHLNRKEKFILFSVRNKYSRYFYRLSFKFYSLILRYINK